MPREINPVSVTALEYTMGMGTRIHHAQTARDVGISLSSSGLVATASPRKLFQTGFEGQSQLKLQTNHSVLHVCSAPIPRLGRQSS